ncbi:MAG: polyprenyl diphosphate synthase [Dermabacteraceae bacterium]|uniref:polyprenyl diphosphate synthase n=2 Tax=Brachybacterium TaxID=43668 RepID=UPI003F8DC681
MTAPDVSARLTPSSVAMPRHVGVIMDGNRRWARAQHLLDPSAGHRAGAEHLSRLLGWLAARGIEHASVYVLSADNIRRRDARELGVLFALLETTIPERVRAAERWQLHVSGDLSLLPGPTQRALRKAVEETRGRPGHLTLAIGYDARADMAAALRRAVSALPEADVEQLTVAAVTAQLAGGPVKDIDLIIRTGGDSRTSGFFPWQSRAAELHVASCPWPAFTESDLEAALTFFAAKRSGAPTDCISATP